MHGLFHDANPSDRRAPVHLDPMAQAVQVNFVDLAAFGAAASQVAVLAANRDTHSA